MENAIVRFREITFDEYVNNIDLSNDYYKIAAPTFLHPRIDTFKNNPFLKDVKFTTLGLSIVNDRIVGRGMYFPTLFKADEEIISCLGGSFLEVHPEYRHLAVGGDIIMNPILHKRSDVLLFAELSDDAIAIYKAMRFTIFMMDRLLQPHSTRFVIQKMGIRGTLESILSKCGDFFLKGVIKTLNGIEYHRYSKFSIEQLSEVPDWVADIATDDGHKYMEYHNKEWFEWNLNNMWDYHEKNRNKLFAIKKNNENVGFLMIKERVCDYSYHNIKSIFTGSVVEWGTKDESIIDEYGINILALKSFSKDIDLINIYSDTPEVTKKLKRILFFKYKPHYMAFRDFTKKHKDAKDKNLWRIRYGCSDAVFN